MYLASAEREAGSQTPSWTRYSAAATVVWCLLAFALRMLLIAGPSLRGDEALSVIYAQRSLPEIVRISRFVSGHPPLFYVLLHFWVKAAGTTEFAVRFFSAWWGGLAIPFAYALGRATFGTRAGAWAAALLAINSFHVWHAQDIRSYSMLIALALLSCWAFWQAFRQPTWRNWGLYAASGLAVTYCHYFGAFLILAHGVFWFVTVLLAARKGLATGFPAKNPFSLRMQWPAALSFATIVVVLLPWLWLAQAVLTGGHGPGGRTLSLGATFQQGLVTFGIGYWREPWGRVLLAVGLALLLAWGAWTAFRQNGRGAGLLVAVVVVPQYDIRPPVAFTVEVGDERHRREPPAGLRAARNRSARYRPERPAISEGERPPGRRDVLEEDDPAPIGAVREARKEILIAVTVPVVEMGNDPAPVVVLVLGQLEGMPARGQAPALDVAVAPHRLVARYERLDPALEQVEVAVAVQVGKAVEVARPDLPAAVLPAEAITVADRSRVPPRPAQAGLAGVEVHGDAARRTVGHHEMERDSTDPVEAFEAPGEEVPLVPLA